MSETRAPLNVLVVDDEPEVAGFLHRLLTREGYEVETARDGSAALEAVAASPPDVVLLDVVLPGLNGFEICRHLKREAATRLLPVVLVTGLVEPEERLMGLEAGADDFLTKPINSHELLARVRSLGRMKRYTDELDSAASIIMTLAIMIESRDGLTEGHCHRMANYAMALGRRLGLPDEDVRALQRGGFLHDIGMLAVPDSVLRKPEPLTDKELNLVKSHTVIGHALCQRFRTLHPVSPIVRSHHEHWDGSGYPDGLSGNDIPLVAQITSVVDAYEAITTRRPYQTPKTVDEAIAILRRQVESGLKQHALVEEFVGIIRGGGLEKLKRAPAQTLEADAQVPWG